jgi:hypothetical protein
MRLKTITVEVTDPLEITLARLTDKVIPCSAPGYKDAFSNRFGLFVSSCDWPLDVLGWDGKIYYKIERVVYEPSVG